MAHTTHYHRQGASIFHRKIVDAPAMQNKGVDSLAICTLDEVHLPIEIVFNCHQIEVLTSLIVQVIPKHVHQHPPTSALEMGTSVRGAVRVRRRLLGPQAIVDGDEWYPALVAMFRVDPAYIHTIMRRLLAMDLVQR